MEAVTLVFEGASGFTCQLSRGLLYFANALEGTYLRGGDSKQSQVPPPKKKPPIFAGGDLVVPLSL